MLKHCCQTRETRKNYRNWKIYIDVRLFDRESNKISAFTLQSNKTTILFDTSTKLKSKKNLISFLSYTSIINWQQQQLKRYKTSLQHALVWNYLWHLVIKQKRQILLKYIQKGSKRDEKLFQHFGKWEKFYFWTLKIAR